MISIMEWVIGSLVSVAVVSLMWWSFAGATRVMSIRPVVAWYDAWVGLFWDGTKRRLYILPVPCLGLVIEFRPPSDEETDR